MPKHRTVSSNFTGQELHHHRTTQTYYKVNRSQIRPNPPPKLLRYGLTKVRAAGVLPETQCAYSATNPNRSSAPPWPNQETRVWTSERGPLLTVIHVPGDQLRCHVSSSIGARRLKSCSHSDPSLQQSGTPREDPIPSRVCSVCRKHLQSIRCEDTLCMAHVRAGRRSGLGCGSCELRVLCKATFSYYSEVHAR